MLDLLESVDALHIKFCRNLYGTVVVALSPPQTLSHHPMEKGRVLLNVKGGGQAHFEEYGNYSTPTL